jgi:hypothetical protein
MKAIFLFK